MPMNCIQDTIETGRLASALWYPLYGERLAEEKHRGKCRKTSVLPPGNVAGPSGRLPAQVPAAVLHHPRCPLERRARHAT